MPTFRVNGTVSYSWIAEVDAEDADVAEERANEEVLDGMHVNSYMPDDVEVYDVRELPKPPTR